MRVVLVELGSVKLGLDLDVVEDCKSAPMERWMKDVRPSVVQVLRWEVEVWPVYATARLVEVELKNIGCLADTLGPERRGATANQSRSSLRAVEGLEVLV